MESLRIVLMGKDFELRLVSLAVRARELAEDVIILDLGSSDGTIELAEKIDCRVLNHQGDTYAPMLGLSLIHI